MKAIDNACNEYARSASERHGHRHAATPPNQRASFAAHS
jgi:hypothetical protein